MRAVLCLIACVPLLALPQTSAAAAAAGVKPQTVTHCIAHMHRELPGEPVASLRPGCICQLNHIRDTVSDQDYAFWEAQLAVMGDERAEPMQRTQNLMRLFQSRGAVASMGKVADAAEEAIDVCNLTTWDTTP